MDHGVVVSVHVGELEKLHKTERESIEVEFDGVIGDRHRGRTRVALEGVDRQPGGTERRNERQWSAISLEDLELIAGELNLPDPLTAGAVAVNLCVKGIPQFSKLCRGTLLTFSSGAELMVEEYNPPCQRMSRHISDQFLNGRGEKLKPSAFARAAKFSRGLVGVVEVPGVISVGDTVIVTKEVLPKWLRSFP